MGAICGKCGLGNTTAAVALGRRDLDRPATARRSDLASRRLAWDGCRLAAESRGPGGSAAPASVPHRALLLWPRRSLDEAHLSAERPQTSPQAWLPSPDAHSWWSSGGAEPPSQGSSSTERLIGPITDRATFRALSQRSQRARVPGLAVRARLGSDATVTEVRVSYAIGRGVGSAVVRNRLRRRLRAILADRHRGADGPLPPGDYLFVAAPGLAELSYAALRDRVGDVIDALAPSDAGDGRSS